MENEMKQSTLLILVMIGIITLFGYADLMVWLSKSKYAVEFMIFAISIVFGLGYLIWKNEE